MIKLREYRHLLNEFEEASDECRRALIEAREASDYSENIVEAREVRHIPIKLFYPPYSKVFIIISS